MRSNESGEMKVFVGKDLASHPVPSVAAVRRCGHESKMEIGTCGATEKAQGRNSSSKEERQETERNS